MVSGSKDCEIVVWDLINESGLYRLKGHKASISSASFIKESKILVSR